MNTKTVPRPSGLPIIGHLHGLVFRDQPEYLLQKAIQHGPVVHLDFGKIKTVVISDPELVQDVLVRRKNDFVKAERARNILENLLGNSLLLSVGDYHAKQRKMIQPAFHANRIHAYGEQMVHSTERLLSMWEAGSERDIHIDMTQLTMEIVAVTLFGSTVKEDAIKVGEAIATLQRNGTDILRRFVHLPHWMRRDFYNREAEANQALERLVKRFIDERRAQGMIDTGDLLSMLLLSEDDDGNRMSDREVRDEAITLFAAGHETTANALTWTWYLLSQHPDVEAKLHAELDTVLAGRRPTVNDLRSLPYTHQVIKEALRLYPPAWTLMVRQTVRDTRLGEYDIPAGWVVFVTPYIMHRHPDYWDEPTKFDPDRFAPNHADQIHRYQYFPFGGGEHVCIGNSFAMMEAALIVATIASRYRMTCVVDQPVQAKVMVTLMPRDGLQMRVEERPTPENTAFQEANTFVR